MTDIAAGRCDQNGKATGVHALATTVGGGPHPTQPSSVTSTAGSLASTVPVQQSAFSVCFTSQQVRQPEFSVIQHDSAS